MMYISLSFGAHQSATIKITSASADFGLAHHDKQYRRGMAPNFRRTEREDIEDEIEELERRLAAAKVRLAAKHPDRVSHELRTVPPKISCKSLKPQ